MNGYGFNPSKRHNSLFTLQKKYFKTNIFKSLRCVQMLKDAMCVCVEADCHYPTQSFQPVHGPSMASWPAHNSSHSNLDSCVELIVFSLDASQWDMVDCGNWRFA